MGKIKSFIIKEIKHILRDKRSLVILIGMPIVQILLFGFAITNEIKYASIGILDKSNDYMSTKLKSKILSSDYFKMNINIQNDEQIHEAFANGTIKAAMIIESDFSNHLNKYNSADIQIISDATDPNTANTLLGYLSNIIADFSGDINKNVKINYLNAELRMRFNQELKGTFLFVPGLVTIILMLVSAMMTSISIAREKESGTLELMLVSPVNPAIFIISKVIPYSALSFINAIVILVLGKFVFGVPVTGNLVLLLSECILFILCALSLGVLIATVTKTQQVALMIALVGLMLPSILLSGFIFPIENMPLWLQYISKFIPATWFMIIIKSIMLKAAGLDLLWEETLIVFSLTMLYILISVKKFKLRLE